MNKTDLVEAVASELELSKADASRTIDAVIACISDGIKRDEKVTLPGFGTFTKKIRAARQGINPATREPMQIPESTTCGFKPSTVLKEAI